MANDGFVVPNAPDAFAFDQAEPDSLDFLVAGNRRSGVVEGGVVTPLNSSSVSVSTVSVVSQGIAGTVTAGTVAVPAADAANTRFDVIIVRRAGSNFALMSLAGPTNLNTNPRFVSVGTAADQFNPETDVLLAALYRPAGSTVQAQHIVDKRIFYGTVITRKGGTLPPAELGREGEVYYWTGARERGQSGFLIKDSSGWQQLMEWDPSLFVPVGTVIQFAGRADRAPNSAYYIECLGQYISIAAYPDLYDQVGDTFGPIQGGTFRLPATPDRYVRGGTAAGQGGGRVSIKLTKDNLPLLTLEGSTGATSPQTSTVTHGGYSHTVGGATRNHGHVMEHKHRGYLFVYPYGSHTDPNTFGNTESYYHLYETKCNGTNHPAGLHVGVAGRMWQHPDQWLHGDRWEQYLDDETREFTAGVHAGQIPANTKFPNGETYESGDHQHSIDSHPGWSHSHTVNSHSHSVTIPPVGKSDPDAINLDPSYVSFRHFIKYR